MKKIALSLFSLAITTLGFQFWFKNWGLTICVIASIVLHELAHTLFCLIYGVRINNIFFIPFLGAAVNPNEDDYDKLTFGQDAAINLAGPTINVILAIIGGLIYIVYPRYDNYGLAMLSINASLTFFNLLPFTVFDGGKFVKDVFESLNERDDKLVATIIVLISSVVGFIIILMGKVSFFYLLITFGIAKKSNEDNPRNTYSDKAMTRNCVFRLVAIYAILLFTTMIIWAIVPNWMEIFHIWPAK